MMRFYATTVIESNSLSVLRQREGCAARTIMTKRALFIATRATKMLYVRVRVDLISQPKAIKAFGFGF